jgi:hypothetical protein
MRTSGSENETTLTIAVLVIAIGLLIAFAGGPSELMLALEHTLRAVAGAVFSIYQNFRA